MAAGLLESFDIELELARTRVEKYAGIYLEHGS